MELNEIRREIDNIDDQLVKLFVARMEAVGRVAASKRETGKPILDHARERAVLNRVAALAGDDCAPYARALYKQIFDLSRAYQSSLYHYETPLADRIADALANTRGKRLPDRALVACQGTEGAYAQQACEKLFACPDILYFDSFEGVFRAVEQGMCRYGILPIENSTAGSVTQVYDLMERHDFHIVGAQKLRIDHRLMRRNGHSKTPITEIVSHEQALRQCSDYLAAHPQIRATPMENTAKAAEYVARCERDDIAVIASRACGGLYGLDVIDDAVANSESNYTRFICISRALEIYPTARKISLMLNLAHEPGSLNQVLNKLAIAGLNVTKLESRPMPGRAFEFRFFFDIAASVADPDVPRLLCELEARSERFVFLGWYDEAN